MNRKKEITESDGALVTKIERVLNRDSAAVIDYLTAENKVLKRVIETLSEKKKRRIVFTEIEKHHNYERPHQGIENRVPIDYNYPDKPVKLNDIRCRSTIGGLLNHYFVGNGDTRIII